MVSQRTSQARQISGKNAVTAAITLAVSDNPVMDSFMTTSPLTLQRLII